MQLYELTAEFMQLQSMLENAEPGEDLQLYFDTIEGIQGEFDDKIAGCAAVYKNLLADEKALKEESKRLAERAAVVNNKAERLKAYMKQAMETVGTVKSGNAVNPVSIAKNGGKIPVIYTEDERNIPEKWKKIEYKLDKTAVSDALNRGEKLPFAHLGERGTRLTIK